MGLAHYSQKLLESHSDITISPAEVLIQAQQSELMSLIQHVSSYDGVDRDGPATEQSLSVVRRQISYDAFPRSAEEESLHRLAPYKVSVAKRIAQVTVTTLACWLASGIVFGFAALKPVLLAEGVYEDLCDKDELQGDIDVCFKQELKLNLFFTVASITANVSALPVGTILDRYGPWICNIAGSFCLAAGSFLMYFAFTIPQFDGYIIGNFFLALGGTFIFVPAFQIANAFPKRSGAIVALVTGAFDASAAVFLFYRLSYEASHGALKPHKFFLGYLVVPVLILLAQLTLLPAQPYQTVYQLEEKIEKAQDPTRDVHESDDEIESDTELERVRLRRRERRQAKIRKLDKVLGAKDERQHRVEQAEERHINSGVWGVLHGQPARKQFMSPWFILITLLTVLQMLRMNYFIATIRAQYEYMLGSEEQAVRINTFFDIALPVGGVFSTPFIGMLLDSLSVPMILSIIVILITVIGALNCLPYVWAGYATVTLFVLLRPLYYSAMSDYATKVFGFATFGRVYGAIICISGVVSFSQYGLDALMQGPFGGDPTPNNIVLAAAGFVVGTALVVFVRIQGKRIMRRHLEEDAQAERERLILEIMEESEEEY